MISTKIKQHFIKKKISKLLANSSHDASKSDKKIVTVGILTKEKFSNSYEFQTMITEKLNLRNPKTYSLRNYEKNQEKSFKHFSEKDFSWKAEIIDPSLISFVDQPFDLLLCYYSKPNSILEYVTLLSKASFKVGFSEVNSNLFDLEIAVESTNPEEFLFEAHKYLNILNKL